MCMEDKLHKHNEINRVWKYMANEDCLPKGEIFFAITGGFTTDEHDALCRKWEKIIIDENDNDYTSWVYTGCTRFSEENEEGDNRVFATIMGFRVRDAY